LLETLLVVFALSAVFIVVFPLVETFTHLKLHWFSKQVLADMQLASFSSSIKGRIYVEVKSNGYKAFDGDNFTLFERKCPKGVELSSTFPQDRFFFKRNGLPSRSGRIDIVASGKRTSVVFSSISGRIRITN